MDNTVKLIKRPTARNVFDQGALHVTVRLGDFGLTHTLIQRGANVNAIDVFGNTALSLACIDKPNISIVRLLLKYNANFNLERELQMDLLLECVLNCHTKTQTDIIRLMIQCGLNIHTTDRLTNRNCMHLVAITGYVPLAELLLERGAILDIRDNHNTTPIGLAKTHENFEVLRLFYTYIGDIQEFVVIE